MALNKEAVEGLKEKKISELIDQYITLRDAVDEETNKLKSRLKTATEVMTCIEACLLEKMEVAGVESSSSKAGTVFFTTSTRCGVGDWDELLPFIIDGNAQLLNKAVNKTAVKEYMDEHEGALPPGVNWAEEKALQIRKK